MAKKFKHHPSSYEIGRYRLSKIETDRAGLGKYQTLTENSIYYYNCLQYCGGALYRATLGYENFWDKKKEAELMLCLDYLLSRYREQGLYYFQTLKVPETMRLHGVPWPRAIPPSHYHFNQQWPYELKAGECLTARINLLDKPNHVDIERPDGSVFTLQFLRYQDYINRGSFVVKKGKGSDEIRRTEKSAAKAPEGRKSQGLRVVRNALKEDPTRPLPNSVLALRKQR